LVKEKRAAMEDPAIMSDAPRLVTAHAEFEEAQRTLDQLIERWAELEEKRAGVRS
jgi:hypothetical protein